MNRFPVVGDVLSFRAQLGEFIVVGSDEAKKSLQMVCRDGPYTVESIVGITVDDLEALANRDFSLKLDITFIRQVKVKLDPHNMVYKIKGDT